MKILQYLHTTHGGHWRYTEELARGLMVAGGRGTDVAIVSGVDAPPSDVRVLRCLTVPDLDREGLNWARDRFRVYRRQAAEFRSCASQEILEGQGKKVCHFQELPSIRPSALIEIAQSLGYRAVITVHNVQPHETSNLALRFKHNLHVRAWRRADLLVVHSQSLVEPLRSTIGESSRPAIAVVPHPVWPSEHCTAPDTRRDFLFFGHLRRNKGIRIFLDSLSALGDPCASIVGDGDPAMVGYIRQHIRELGLQRCQFRPGFVSDGEVARVFAAHKVLVAPYTHFAAQSGVTHLAITFGIPMVVSDVGALGDPVRAFGLGEVVATDADFPQAMSRVLEGSDMGLYDDALGRAGEVLSPPKIAHQLMEAYEQIEEENSEGARRA